MSNSNWALKGLEVLGDNGGFIVPKAGRALIEQYRTDANPARQFLQENYVECFDDAVLACKEVYESYVHWCSENGYKPVNHSNFGKEVKRTFPTVNKERSSDNGRRIQVYTGLAVCEGSEITQPDFMAGSHCF